MGKNDLYLEATTLIRGRASREQTVCRDRSRLGPSSVDAMHWEADNTGRRSIWRNTLWKEPPTEKALKKGSWWHPRLDWKLLGCKLPSFLDVQQNSGLALGPPGAGRCATTAVRTEGSHFTRPFNLGLNSQNEPNPTPHAWWGCHPQQACRHTG